MKITVKRSWPLKKCIIGEVLIDGVHFAWSLEDVERDKKVYGETAIPKGIYNVIVDMSTRFKKEMPHILNVKGFDGVRIHGGNTDADTLGCILIGKDKWPDLQKIGNCADVVTEITKKIKESKTPVTIEII